MNIIHLCKTSQLLQKIYIFLCIGLEFRSHNSAFTRCYCLSWCFFQAFTSFVTSPFDMALFTTACPEKKKILYLCVAQRQNKWNSRTSSRKGRKQATETEWNFSVFFYIQNVSKDKRQFPPATLRIFISSLHKNRIWTTIWKLNSESLKTELRSLIKHMWNPSRT